jgi:hypothetical protein
VHARIFLLGGFVSVENKGRCIYLPKLVIRVRFPSPAPNSLVILKLKFQKLEKRYQRPPKRPPQGLVFGPAEMSDSRGENDADRPASKSLSLGAFDVAAVKAKRPIVIQWNLADG